MRLGDFLMQADVDRQLRRWYVAQLVVLIGALLVRLLANGLGSSLLGVMLLLWFFSAMLPVYEQGVADKSWSYFRRFNHYLQTILQFSVFPLLLGNLIWMLSHWTRLDQQGLIAVGFTYLLILFVPVGYVVTRPVGSLVGRIMLLISVVFSGVVGAHEVFLITPGLTAIPASFTMVGNSGVLGAFGFVTAFGVLMMAWGFQLPTWRLNRSTNGWVLTLIGLLALGFVIWNAFGSGDSLATLFTRYTIEMKSPSWKMFLSGLEPGIAEEWLYRFGILSLLLWRFRHAKHQIGWAVGLSSLLFGLWHSTNILAGQAVSATLEQMVFAMALGSFLAASYLYTGSFAVPIMIHTLTDCLSMMASGTQTMSQPDLLEWQSMGILVVVFGLMTLFLLTGSRRRVVEAHTQRFLRL